MAISPTHKKLLGSGGVFFLGVLVTALVGYFLMVNANSKMVLQQQQLTEVQSFDSTGGALDNAVREFSDALATNRRVEEARASLRAAIASHSSNVFTIRTKVGEADYNRYMGKLVELRQFADRATNAEEGVAVWQSTADLIAYRQRLSGRLRREADAT